ncbi:MAG TPA: ABC transporter substrate-binding protein [Candidatus Methylomirabilis sp.]|nr:ABC transporter substrate-binding protein [Candidatus Methylomirabilis sp.]
MTRSSCGKMAGDRAGAKMANLGLGGVALVLALAMAGVAAGASPAPENSGGPATEAIRGSISQVFGLLGDPTLKKPEKAEERRRQLEKLVAERICYAEMAKRSLGVHWQDLSEAEQEEFVTLFQRLLAKTYLHMIEGYTGEQIRYLGERVTEDFAEVRTRIVSEKMDIPVDYRLLRMAGEWRVYDVVVDGISLVNNYRGQFAKIIRASSYASLVEQLRKKVGADDRPSRISALASPRS